MEIKKYVPKNAIVSILSVSVRRFFFFTTYIKTICFIISIVQPECNLSNSMLSRFMLTPALLSLSLCVQTCSVLYKPAEYCVNLQCPYLCKSKICAYILYIMYITCIECLARYYYFFIENKYNIVLSLGDILHGYLQYT